MGVISRLVLKTANRHGWIDYLPDLTSPFGTSGKISHRAWFAPDEYRQFYEASRAQAKAPKSERWRVPNEDLHDFILFMVNSGLRPDEAKRIQVRDIEVAAVGANDERTPRPALPGGALWC